MKQNTAKQILQTATFLFATLGFEKVTLTTLANEANSNPAAVSYYFGGKERLYQEVLTRQFSPVQQSLQTVDSKPAITALEHLRGYAKMMADFQRKQPCLNSLWHYEINRLQTSHGSFVMKEYATLFHQSIFRTLSLGISQNEFLPHLEPGSTASVLLDLLHTPYVSLSQLARQTSISRPTANNYTVQAITLFLRGIQRIPQ
ncbi:MAG: TetR/AcrR family transcriptional regulator [Sporomusaceae bacterium]|nr:TetR/AcrR family transcriptional regulator [Sporomusaceae bacterium]